MFLILITLAGFIIGLGAVTVIDIHGFLARKSSYWTEATIRSHRVTKPLIWIGLFLCLSGISFLYEGKLLLVQYIIFLILILNGVFLSFRISPFLLKKEKEGRSQELLSQKIQKQITASFIISFLGWWGSVVLFAYALTIL